MRKTVSITAGTIVAAVLTHGFVYSSVRLAGPLSPLTYRGIFQDAVLAIWNVWNFVRGWPPGRNHVDEFGRFCLAPFVLFVCPLVGFGLFAVICRLRITWNWWKPVVLALVLTAASMSFPNPLRAAGLDVPLAEAARSIVVFLLMVWSAGGMRFSTDRQVAAVSPTPATT